MTLLQIHVAISLVAIIGSFLVIFGMLANQRLYSPTALTLIFTILTSVTGFFLPLHGLNPPVIVGIVSLVVLAIAVFARYSKQMAGVWRPVYIITAMFAFYLNFFVLVAQSFQKVPALKPMDGGPVFLATQVAALLFFIIATVFSIKRFRA